LKAVLSLVESTPRSHEQIGSDKKMNNSGGGSASAVVSGFPQKDTSDLKSVCVFCGSSPGADPDYAASAKRLGSRLARTGRTLVYGGGHVGLMGAVADAALAEGGTVVGVIPRSLADKEIIHRGLTDLKVVGSMHERKSLMAELADAFIMLPGGIGTLEEFFEIWTWSQLGLHFKPYGLLDVAGFFKPLLAFLDMLVEQRFVRPEHREMLFTDDDPSRLLERMHCHCPSYLSKWVDLPKCMTQATL
jgi:uncharacterized protein (TIGR00730 family)